MCRLSDERIALLYAHFSLYQRWNRVLNLSSIRDFQAVVVRHYCESLFLAAHLPKEPVSIIDVGSGAGFPGIPVAILHPDCHVGLVESHQRKAVFLKEASRILSNVEVLPGRAEELEGIFDWLISRAVAWEDLRPVALKNAKGVALLMSAAEVVNVSKTSVLIWKPPIPLPWAPRSVLLMGNVPRETCYDS